MHCVMQSTHHVGSVGIDYAHFRPSGSAFLKVGTEEALEYNLGKLKNASIAGFHIEAKRIFSSPHTLMARAERGSELCGHGIQAGLASMAPHHVILRGLPVNAQSEDLEATLEPFAVAEGDNLTPQIRKVPKYAV